MLNISIRRVNKIFMNWNPSFKYSKHPTFISSCLPKSTDFEPLNNSLKFFYRFKFYEILSVHGTLSEECKPQVSFKSDESNSNGRASTHFPPFFSFRSNPPTLKIHCGSPDARITTKIGTFSADCVYFELTKFQRSISLI